MNWMRDVDAQRRESREALRADLAEVRQEMHARFSELRQEMRVGLAGLETRFERRFGDLIKRSFVFWVGAVGAVALLARALSP